MPKNLEDNSFTESVRAVVRTIPLGHTLSYQAVAEKVGSPNAARAVARIMAANYDPDIPCHRVIRKDGTCGGYNRGGEAAKRAILQRERESLTK